MLDKEPEIVAGIACVLLCLVLAWILRSCMNILQ
jgi:hypothetical protein